jgi:hypothetical protein
MSFRLLAVALVATFAAATPAAAATIDFQDIFDPSGVFLSASGVNQCDGINLAGDGSDSVTGTLCSSLSFSQTLTGYVSPPNVLQTATLQIWLNDDGPGGVPDAEPETFTLTGITDIWTNLSVGSPTGPLDVFAQVSNGVLNLLLTATTGDFHFDKAQLDATWLDQDEPEVPPVPEPASLLLLGAGAIAVAYQVRKAKRS